LLSFYAFAFGLKEKTNPNKKTIKTTVYAFVFFFVAFSLSVLLLLRIPTRVPKRKKAFVSFFL
jgi:hypothetical protein